MCFGQSDPRGLVAFFLLFTRFCGVIKRGDNVDIVDIVDIVDKKRLQPALTDCSPNLKRLVSK